MRFYIILFCIQFISDNCISQTINQLERFGYNSLYSVDIIKDNDNNLIMTGTSQYDTSMYNIMYALKLDSTCVVIDNYERTNPNIGHYYFGVYSSLINTENNGYVTVGTASGDTSVFIKLTQDFELDQIKEFRLPNNPVYTQFREVLEVDDGYIIGGQFQHLDLEIGAYTIKLDNDLNQVWFKTYDTPNLREEVFSICQLTNGEIIVGAVIQNGDMMSIDPNNGDILWQNDNNNFYTGTMRLQPTSDGGFIRGAMKDYGTIDNMQLRFRVQRYDENKNLVWDKEYDKHWELDYEFTGLYPTPDGHFVACAYGYDFDLGGQISMIWKFDANSGEKIWEYIYPEKILADDYTSFQSFIQGVTVLPSGSIYCIGDVNHNGPDPGWSTWLMKLSPDGCFAPDSCATIIVDIEDIIDNNLIQPKVITYPDPTSDFIQFKLTQGLIHPSERYGTHIYDVSGKTIYRATDTDYLSDIQIDVCDYASGIYFYTLHGDKGGVYTGQFVKK